MGGGEAGFRGSDRANFNQTDIDNFAKTGFVGAEKLSDAQRNFTSTGGGGKSYGSWTTSSGEDIGTVVSAFKDWVEKQRETNRQYSEYIKLSQDRPGRQQTILTEPSKKTVLG